MNKKGVIVIIAIIICIIVAIAIFIPKQNKKEGAIQGNEITKEEYNEKMLEKVMGKLSQSGIKLTQNEITSLENLNGYSYTVIENGVQSKKTLEIYTIDIQDRRNILGENAKTGKVTVNGKTNGILYANILIANISDNDLTNQIMKALNI